MEEEGKKGGFFKKTKSKISEFFLHLVTYGGFNYQDGEIYTFNNPYTFIPLSVLTKLQIELKKEVSKDSDELIQWLGRVDGNTAALILVSRYGVKKDNIERLLEAGTLTGLGKLELKEVDLKKRVIITAKDSPLAKYYKKSHGKSKEPVDHYITGALVGADIAVTGKEAIGKETKCIAKGDKICEYEFTYGKYKRPNLLLKAGIDADKIIKKISKSFLNRLKTTKVSFKQKDIKFGDGNFVFNNIKGLSIPVFVLVILNETLTKISPKKRERIYQDISKEYIKELQKVKLKKPYTITQINQILDQLSMFGLGKFTAKTYIKEKLIIENQKSSFAKEYITIFGTQKENIDYLATGIIKEQLQRYLGVDLEVKEIECVANRKKKCIFEVSTK